MKELLAADKIGSLSGFRPLLALITRCCGVIFSFKITSKASQKNKTDHPKLLRSLTELPEQKVRQVQGDLGKNCQNYDTKDHAQNKGDNTLKDCLHRDVFGYAANSEHNDPYWRRNLSHLH